MKLNAIKFLVASVILLSVFLFISCNKDNTAPTITIIGSNPVNTCLDMDYQDAGAVATDDEDGDISDKIETTINVNTSVIGTYSVIYIVEDEAGNTATATRTVSPRRLARHQALLQISAPWRWRQNGST